MSDSDYIGKMISAEIEKRTYIDNPMEVPEGASVQEGPQGGYYYEDYDGGGDGDGISGAVAFQTNPRGVGGFTTASALTSRLSVSDQPSWGRRLDHYRGTNSPEAFQTNPRGVGGP
jgi:hypothetical protein